MPRALKSDQVEDPGIYIYIMFQAFSRTRWQRGIWLRHVSRRTRRGPAPSAARTRCAEVPLGIGRAGWRTLVRGKCIGSLACAVWLEV